MFVVQMIRHRRAETKFSETQLTHFWGIEAFKLKGKNGHELKYIDPFFTTSKTNSQKYYEEVFLKIVKIDYKLEK